MESCKVYVHVTAEFTKEKKRALIRLEQQKESPRSVIGSYFDKFLYRPTSSCYSVFKVHFTVDQ